MFARAFVALGAAALFLLGPASAGAAARSCTVDAVEGPEAQVWAAGAWSPLSPGQAVALESKVSTGPGTRVRIACDDGIVVTVGTRTEVNLESLVATTGSAVLQLIDGIVGLLVPERLGGVEVRTPLAIASVRSTEWLVEHGAEDGSAVFVRAGRVGVRLRAGGAVTLGAGEGVSVAPDGTPGAVKSWGAARIARSTGALGFDWQ